MRALSSTHLCEPLLLQGENVLRCFSEAVMLSKLNQGRTEYSKSVWLSKNDFIDSQLSDLTASKLLSGFLL